MLTIFEHVKNILGKKERVTIKDSEDYSPYMIQRWASMVSPQICFVLNETINTFHLSMENKQMWNDAFLTFIPSVKYKKLNYIKKVKSEPSEDLVEYAKRNRISVREAKEIFELDPEINKKEKTVEVFKRAT